MQDDLDLYCSPVDSTAAKDSLDEWQKVLLTLHAGWSRSSLLTISFWSSQGVFDNQNRVKVLQPSQPIRVMSSQSVYQNKLFMEQALSFKQLTSICAYFFIRNRQLPFLNQQKGEDDCRKYFRINLMKECCRTGVDRTHNLTTSRTSIQLSHRGWQCLDEQQRFSSHYNDMQNDPDLLCSLVDSTAAYDYIDEQ